MDLPITNYNVADDADDDDSGGNNGIYCEVMYRVPFQVLYIDYSM